MWEIFSKSQNIIYGFQAKDKAHLQKLFTHFCSRTANEEEEIAHKLLGEQFRVSYLLVISAWRANSLRYKKSKVQIQTQCHAVMVILALHSSNKQRTPGVMCIFCYVKYYMKLFQRIFVGAVGLAAQPFYRSTLWRPSRPGKYVLWSHSTRCFLLFSIQRSFIFLENAAKNITESGCCSRQLIKAAHWWN